MRIAHLAPSLLLFFGATAYADDPLTWRFFPGDGYASAILTNCDECDYIEMAISCEEGSGEIGMSVALDVEGGAVDEERGITFLFGDGAIDRRAILVANEMDAIIEPMVTVSADDELIATMRDFVSEPQIAVSEAERQATAAATSMEVLVENAGSKTVPLAGLGAILDEMLPLCSGGG